MHQADGYPRLSASLLHELEVALDLHLPDASCEGLVLHGTEKCFAAGAEIAEVSALSGTAALDFARRTQQLFERLSQSPKPVIAAVSGYCLGGGFDLAVACHARVAAADAVFGHPGATLGLITGWGGTQRLSRLVGRGRALEMLLTGESIGAERALTIGLVTELVAPAELLARAKDYAARRRTAYPSPRWKRSSG
jgi:enoyl-CoA hydratase